MSAGTVHVAVGNLFRGSLAYIHDFHIKIEVDAGQGVVGVYGYLLQPYVGDGYYHAVVGVKLHSLLHFLVAKRRAGYFLDEGLIADTVAFFRADFQFQFHAFLLAFEAFLHSGDQIAFAVEVV